MVDERYSTNVLDGGMIVGCDATMAIRWAEDGWIDAVRDARGTIWIDPESVHEVFERIRKHPTDAPPPFTPLPAPNYATMPESSPSPAPAKQGLRTQKRPNIDLSHHDEMEHDGETWCRRSFFDSEMQRVMTRERMRMLDDFREVEQTARDQAKRLQNKIDRLAEEHRDEIETIRRRNRDETEAMILRHRGELERERDQHRAEQDANAKRKELWVELETERAKERVRSADGQLAEAVRARSEAEAKAARVEAQLAESRTQWAAEQLKTAEERATLRGKLQTAGRQSERLQEIEGIAQLTKIATDAPEATKPMIMAAVAQQLGLPPATTWDRIIEAAAANPEAIGDLVGRVVSIVSAKLGLEESNPPAPQAVTVSLGTEKKTASRAPSRASDSKYTGPREL